MFDANKVEKIMHHSFCERCDDHNGFRCTSCSVQKVLDIIKSADNMVRCRDCKYSAQSAVNENGFIVCPVSGMEITQDDYCSYAERA